MKIKICLEHCEHAHFIRYIRLRLTNAIHALHEQSTVEQSGTKFCFEKGVEEELSNSAARQLIHMDGQRCSGNRTNLLSSSLP